MLHISALSLDYNYVDLICNKSNINDFYYFTHNSLIFNPIIRVNNFSIGCSYYDYVIYLFIKRDNHIFDNKLNLDYLIN
jgi:hypothetical protein